MENEEAMREPFAAEEEPKKTKDRKKKKKKRQQSNFFKCFYEADYLVFKGFCFFIYGAYGGFIPYLPLYFKQLFLGASYAGIIIGIRPLIQCIGAPFWGIIADRYHAGKVIFLGSVIAWIVKAFVLLAVRPQNQHCIEIYKNETANVSYVYAYDLWNTEPGAEADWVVLPLDHPVIVEKNKVSVVDSKETEEPTSNSLPGQVLEKNAPVAKEGSNVIKKNQGQADIQAVNKTIERKTRGLRSVRAERESRIFKRRHKQKTSVETKPNRNVQRLSDTLNLKIVHQVKVYSEDLKSPVTFITKVDTYEIDFMFVMFMFIIIIGEFLESPTYALSDASLLKRLGEDREYYGRIRMWGSLGWAVAAAMVGLIVMSSRFKLCEVEQNNYIVAFYIFVGFVAAAFVNGLWFRFSYDEEKQFEDIGKVAPMLLSPRHISFLLATLYTGFCYGILVHFVNWFIDDLGGSSAIMGAAGAAREIAALIMFAFSASALQALGNVNMMVFCLMSYIICFICYSILSDPWMAVALEVLDGGTYGLVWSTCVNYMSGVGSQLGVIETTQGILQGIFWGLGNGGGTMISGTLIEIYGIIDTFRAFAIAGTVVLAILVIIQYTASLLEQREKQRQEYDLLSDSDDSKSEGTNDGEETQPQPKE